MNDQDADRMLDCDQWALSSLFLTKHRAHYSQKQ